MPDSLRELAEKAIATVSQPGWSADAIAADVPVRPRHLLAMLDVIEAARSFVMDDDQGKPGPRGDVARALARYDVAQQGEAVTADLITRLREAADDCLGNATGELLQEAADALEQAEKELKSAGEHADYLISRLDKHIEYGVIADTKLEQAKKALRYCADAENWRPIENPPLGMTYPTPQSVAAEALAALDALNEEKG